MHLHGSSADEHLDKATQILAVADLSYQEADSIASIYKADAHQFQGVSEFFLK